MLQTVPFLQERLENQRVSQRKSRRSPERRNGVYMPPALRLHTRRLQSTREDDAEQHADDVVVLWTCRQAGGDCCKLPAKQRELRHFFRQQ